MTSISFVALGTIGDVLPLLTIAYAVRQHINSDCPESDIKFVKFVSHKELLNQILTEVAKLQKSDEAPTPISEDQRFLHENVKIAFHFLNSECISQHECQTLNGNEIEEIISATHTSKLLCFNLFAKVCWHIAQKYQIHCIVLSPCPLPSRMPTNFESAFMEEYGSQLTGQLKRHTQQTSKRINWVDIKHWMWRLCLDDEGEIREKYLGLPASIFDDVNGKHIIPRRIPICYLYDDCVWNGVDELPQDVRTVGFLTDIEETLFAKKTNPDDSVKFESVSGTAIVRCHVKSVVSALLPDWLMNEQEFIYINFSSMQTKEVQLVPISKMLVVLIKFAEISSYRVLFHVPVYSMNGKGNQFALSNAHDISIHQPASWAPVCVCHGFGCVKQLVQHTQCACMITHGGTGSVGMALHSSKPHVIIPCMFDQFMWASELNLRGFALEVEGFFDSNWNTEKEIEATAKLLTKYIHDAIDLKVGMTVNKIPLVANATQTCVNEVLKQLIDA